MDNNEIDNGENETRINTKINWNFIFDDFEGDLHVWKRACAIEMDNVKLCQLFISLDANASGGFRSMKIM